MPVANHDHMPMQSWIDEERSVQRPGAVDNGSDQDSDGPCVAGESPAKRLSEAVEAVSNKRLRRREVFNASAGSQGTNMREL